MIINGKEYFLVWEDKFEGAELSSDWQHEIWPPKRVNKEIQSYTALEENVSVSDGSLKITALRKGFNSWTSGRIITTGKRFYTYGYFECSAKLPEGKGVWPAFWMMPEKPVYGNWPMSGEIDIMEYSPKTHGSNYFTTLHTGPEENSPKHNISTLIEAPIPENAFTSFHRYGILWTKDALIPYLDGKPVGKTYAASEDKSLWPFDKPFHLILNLAMGGTLGGHIPHSLKKAVFEIEAVRVFQEKTDSMST